MKTCIFITGTNCVGKTSLAKAIIEKHGGIRELQNNVTYLNDGGVCLAGKYTDKGRYGGVDWLSNTRVLASVVEEGLKKADTIICEGSYLDTLGTNLLQAMFKAEKHLVVSLYADRKTIYQRLLQRSNGIRDNGKRNWERIWRKQTHCMESAKRWQSIGVPVLQFNTAETTIDEEIEKIINYIKS